MTEGLLGHRTVDFQRIFQQGPRLKERIEGIDLPWIEPNHIEEEAPADGPWTSPNEPSRRDGDLVDETMKRSNGLAGTGAAFRVTWRSGWSPFALSSNVASRPGSTS
jgi:hypothetical protein